MESERKRLREEKNLAAEEKTKIQLELEKHETELAQAQKEHDAAKAKLASLEKKIIIGGENLLEKAEEQERLLEESAKQLEDTVRSEAAIRKALRQREAERLDIEEKYSRCDLLKKAFNLITFNGDTSGFFLAARKKKPWGNVINVMKHVSPVKQKLKVF